MKNMSDEELVRKYIISHIQCFIRNLPEHHQWSKERDSLKAEILSRLERGRKAMEAMNKVGMCISVLNDFNVKYKMNDIIEIFREYQQSCKEATRCQ